MRKKHFYRWPPRLHPKEAGPQRPQNFLDPTYAQTIWPIQRLTLGGWHMLGRNVFLDDQLRSRSTGAGLGPAFPKLLELSVHTVWETTTKFCTLIKIGARKLLQSRLRMFARDLFAVAKLALLLMGCRIVRIQARHTRHRAVVFSRRGRVQAARLSPSSSDALVNPLTRFWTVADRAFSLAALFRSGTVFLRMSRQRARCPSSSGILRPSCLPEVVQQLRPGCHRHCQHFAPVYRAFCTPVA